jgi:hypothetical protein
MSVGGNGRRVQRFVTVCRVGALAWLAWAVRTAGEADDFAARCADREAVERVYYEHRLGAKPPFEQAVPRTLTERMVREERCKETVLKRVYGVEITPAQVEAEVSRINETTRAPDILADLKRALGDDPQRFARTVARPIVVERELRGRFENDDKLHTAPRQEAEKLRANLLRAKSDGATADALVAKLKESKAGSVSEITWLLLPRRGAGASPPLPPAPGPAQGRATGGVYSVEATMQTAKALATPSARDGENQSHFEDLPDDLRRVLGAQLRQAGDLSAVIDTPGGFLLYIARVRTTETLTVVVLQIPKRPYEEWLHGQASNGNSESGASPKSGLSGAGAMTSGMQTERTPGIHSRPFVRPV